MNKYMNMATGKLVRQYYSAHSQWLRSGGLGKGQLKLEGELLRGLNVSALNLSKAQFQYCDFYKSDFNNAHLVAVQAQDCDFSSSNFFMTWLKQAVLSNCQFKGSVLSLGRLDSSFSSGCNFDQSDMKRVTLVDAKCDNCSFDKACLGDIRISNSVFSDCAFQDADFSRSTTLTRLGLIENSTFLRCDFRGADFSGLQIDRTEFYKCKFHGLKGKPESLSDVKVTAADLSKLGDGSIPHDTDDFLTLYH